jgi:hypothetical protein
MPARANSAQLVQVMVTRAVEGEAVPRPYRAPLPVQLDLLMLHSGVRVHRNLDVASRVTLA